ncbi:MAG: hypothetical protein HY918_02105 [Candidatus Doudnabacteria bacterium]|nr:hypothetical protein [Candidatus Doudnabacteria bacterium]
MQAEKLENLKSLISSSPILLPQERTEWLTLLGLMNDKQLNELEKILQSGIKNQELRIKEETQTTSSQKSASQVASFQPAILKSEAPKQVPNLSHIMNLPKTFDGKPAALKIPQNQTSGFNFKPYGVSLDKPAIKAAPAVSSVDQKAKSGFASKLKSIFTEKELTTSQPKYELKLPPPEVPKPKPKVVAQPTAEAKPVVQPKPSAIPAVQQKSVVTPLAQPKPITEKKTEMAPVQTPQVKPELKKELEKIVPTVPQSVESILASLKKPAETPIFNKAEHQAPVQQQPRPARQTSGLNFGHASEKIRQDTLASVKQHLEETGRSQNVPIFQKVLPKNWDIKSLEDLKAMDALILTADLSTVAKKIKKLYSSHDFHDVIFSLENSELYKNYLKTGTEILTKQTDFENLNPASGFLDRSQFEKFTDLLREIQGE